MNFSDIAKLVGGVAPTVATMLLGPLAGAAVQILAGALGTDSTPEAVGTAIQQGGDVVSAALTKSEAEASAKWPALAAIAAAQADAAKAQVTAVNETIRAEVAARAAAPDGWWGNWRTILAYELAAECPYWAGLIGYCIFAGKVNDLVMLIGLITTWWGARFGILGVHVWTGSNERQTAMTGAVQGGISNIVKAVTGKR